MLAPQIRLHTSQRDDLAVACGLGADVLRKLASKIEASDFTIRRTRIEGIITSEIGRERGVPLARMLFGLASTFRRAFLSADDALDSVTASLGDALHTDPRFAKWNECRGGLKKLLETKSVSLAAKAIDISYDFERGYLTGRLLTSVRPVFDDQREDIVGTTIVQTLRLEYIAPNGDQSNISVAMDRDDIIKLADERERAVKKADRAKTRFEKDCEFDAIIPGEETDE